MSIANLMSKALPLGVVVMALLAPLGARANHYRVLYSFCNNDPPQCLDGNSPQAGLIENKNGDLVGTTLYGGAGTGKNGGPMGTIFELIPPAKGQTQWSESVLYSFCTKTGCPDGYGPVGGVIGDRYGNLYGTTGGGGRAGCGENDCGAVFKLAPNGKERSLYTFCAQAHCTDGNGPRAGLVADKAGNLYGTTYLGGSCQCNGGDGAGTVFKISPDGSESVLYSFCTVAGCTDGFGPMAGVVMDSSGNLYGTTTEGGAPGGMGVVFKLAPNGAETVLDTFCAQAGCADGADPQAGLAMDASGNLYGTTVTGGQQNTNDCYSYGCGVVFKLAPDGTETVLHAFTGGSDAESPYAGVIVDKAGNVYGTTLRTVFKIAPNGTETVLHHFCSRANCTDGWSSYAALFKMQHRLYGATAYGGANCENTCGTVFSVKP